MLASQTDRYTDDELINRIQTLYARSYDRPARYRVGISRTINRLEREAIRRGLI